MPRGDSGIKIASTALMVSRLITTPPSCESDSVHTPSGVGALLLAGVNALVRQPCTPLAIHGSGLKAYDSLPPTRATGQQHHQGLLSCAPLAATSTVGITFRNYLKADVCDCNVHVGMDGLRMCDAASQHASVPFSGDCSSPASSCFVASSSPAFSNTIDISSSFDNSIVSPPTRSLLYGFSPHSLPNDLQIQAQECISH
ncbi:hypothetical protein Cgig2_012521 [Carnegiea gigantea]|uniref:Uncharacterized protein n=1 Tax=Carnegiea gigantea TaxID=171969 RepID=A0A9Q1JLN9_9CARY|nr:hypothetical protein Cgig2_012521 [Carnegiea gigantea]